MCRCYVASASARSNLACLTRVHGKLRDLDCAKSQRCGIYGTHVCKYELSIIFGGCVDEYM